MKIETSEQVISPKMADEILTSHFKKIEKDEFRQRTISPVMVARFAADMRAGLWQLSPQPISFDEKGNLIDGQHRLLALKAAGVSVPFMVSRGWPASSGPDDNGALQQSTIDILDRGRSRSIGGQLQLHGVSNPNVVASSCTAACIVAYDGLRVSLSYPQAAQLLDKLGFKEHLNAIMAIAHTTHQTFTRSGRTLGPLAFYHSCRPNKAKEFMRAITSLDFKPGSGPQVFTKYVLAGYKARGETPQITIVKALSNAIMYWDQNETVRHVTNSPQGTRWLSEQNPKLRDAIRALVGPLRVNKFQTLK